MQTTFLYKKKYVFLTMVWVLFSTQIFCQSYTDALKYFYEGRIIDAKQQIDEYLIEKDTAVNGLLLKSRIYYVIGTSQQYSDVVADGKSVAINALKTANDLNANLVNSILKLENFGLPINLYNDLCNDGMIHFNSAIERKDKILYEQALSKFKKAIAFSSYINENKWGLQKLDSNNLFYAAKAAIYAGKQEDGLLFAKNIADNLIVKTTENKSFQPIYEWLVYYYRITKNEESLQRYTDFSMLNFSQSPYFILNKIDWLREDKQYNILVPQYKFLFSKGFKQANYYTAYFNDVFNIIFAVNDSNINKKYYKTTFEKEITGYIAKNKLAFKEMLLAGKYYRSLAAEMQLANAPKKNINIALSKSTTFLKLLFNKPKGLVNENVLAEAKKMMK